ncbi:MAG: hypothetical protein ACK6BN_03855, partial [Pseudanabaena sp.]
IQKNKFVYLNNKIITPCTYIFLKFFASKYFKKTSWFAFERKVLLMRTILDLVFNQALQDFDSWKIS